MKDVIFREYAHAPRPMVVHVVASLGFGGVERRLQVLARASKHGRWDHVFCALGRDGEAAHGLKQTGVSVECLHKSVDIPSAGALSALYRLLARLQPTAVHAHGAEGNFHGLIAAWLAGVPVRIGEEIGMPKHSRKAKYAFRQVFRLADRVIGVSDAVTNWLVEHREVPEYKAVRVYNPVELAADRVSQPVQGDVFRVGFVGRLEAVKNLLALIEAVATLSEKDIPIELWIIGEGSERNAIEDRVGYLGLAGKVRLWGYQEHPLQYVKQCHLYIQPSLSEGFSNAVVEAMSCQVPVIATTVGGSPEIVKEGVTGWLVENTAAEGLADALYEAWRRRNSLNAMGVDARKSVMHRFEPSAYVERLESLYESLLDRSRYR